MYRLSETIASELPLNQIPEVAFNENGDRFVVTYQQSNEVLVYDSRTRAVLQTYRNPEAALDHPHGVVVTGRHIIVSNTYAKLRPSSFTVYRLGDDATEPVSHFETPDPLLREAHSLTYHNGVLVVTYCHSAKGNGAIVSYQFDDEAGRITRTLDIRKPSLEKFGDPKGVAFNRDGTSVYFTYSTPKRMTGVDNQTRRLKVARRILRDNGVVGLFEHLRTRARQRVIALISSNPGINNGISVYSISEQGQFSQQPLQVLERAAFCRLENISIVGDTLVLSDTINGKVCLHSLTDDPQLHMPTLTITESVTLPHGAKLSPDKKMLVVTNYGLKAENQVIHWNTPAANSSNRVLVYDLQAS